MRDYRDFDEQFRETPAERNERLRESRSKRTIETLQTLIYDMSGMLTDEGDDLTDAGLAYFRQRVADALGPKCPEWLAAKTNTILDTAKPAGSLTFAGMPVVVDPNLTGDQFRIVPAKSAPDPLAKLRREVEALLSPEPMSSVGHMHDGWIRQVLALIDRERGSEQEAGDA